MSRNTRCVGRGAWYFPVPVWYPATQAVPSFGAVSNNAQCTTHKPFGFTLIELLVVIVVISLLAGLVGPMVFRNVGDAKVTAARAQLELFGLALDQYRLDNDYYPSAAQGLEALRSLPGGEPAARNWRGPYLRKLVPLDPWGRPFLYKSPGERNPTGYDLLTYGRDGKSGGVGEDADVEQ